MVRDLLILPVSFHETHPHSPLLGLVNSEFLYTLKFNVDLLSVSLALAFSQTKFALSDASFFLRNFLSKSIGFL
ncbi:MAG: hypothetical protein ACJAQ4_001900 [Cryomorphaceae bacterium]|jgi:hypothetical protein